MISYLRKQDHKLAGLIQSETKRQQWTLDLIPSENIVSPAALEALGSPLGNKYSEGYPGKRYYAGNKIIDEIELLAQERARKVFRLGEQWHVNVQTLSGSPANMAVYLALMQPGDTFLAMGLPFGGHLTHGDPVNFSGRIFNPVHYALNKKGYIDYAEVGNLARKHRPKIIVAGVTSYSRSIYFYKFSQL